METTFDPALDLDGWFGELSVESWFDEDFTEDSAPPSSTLIFEEDFEGSAGAAMSTSNTDWELFNGAGTSTLQSSPSPIYGSTLGRYQGGQALTKDTDSMPGTTNGGTVLRDVYCRGYFYVDVASGLTLSRMIVFEESVANGGADVGGLRLNANGTFRPMDGASTTGSASTRVLSTDATRIELRLNQNTNEITYRMWWGADLQSESTSATNYETQTATLNTNTDMEVFGVGFYASQSNTRNLYVEEFAVGYGDWIGPAAVAAPPSIGAFGVLIG